MGTHPIFESDFDCLTDCMVTIQEIVVDGLDAAKHAFVKPVELPPRSPVQVVQEAGGGLVSLSVLQQLGYVKVDWKRLEADYNKLKCRNPNMSLENIRYTELMKENVPFTGGVAGGFFLALGR